MEKRRERTSLNLDTDLLTQLREIAHNRNETLTAVVQEFLRSAVWAATEAKKERYSFKPLIVKGESPPAVDISSRRELFDFLDDDRS